MAQLTTQPTGYGNFYGDSYGGAYAYCIGTQQQYDSLSSVVKSTIIAGYTTGIEVHNALIVTPPTQPVTIYPLDRSLDVSMIQSSYDGQPVTISYEYCGSCRRRNNSVFYRGFGFRL